MKDPAPASSILSNVFHDEAGRLTAHLTGRLGNFDLAEESVQDAIVEALEHWPVAGVPANPGGWLAATARRKAIDRIRRSGRLQAKLEILARSVEPPPVAEIADERLQLLFMCCHPALGRAAQVSLTLRAVAGLTTAQIARAFLVPEATVAQRIVRAKRKIVDAAIPLRTPDATQVHDRVNEVLSVLYLMFNEGYLGSVDTQQPQLTADAEWLCSLVVQLLPEAAEALGLLALMRIHRARDAARFSVAGDLILIQDQDRSRWDHAAIAASGQLIEQAAAMRRPGPYQLQAAIAAVHAESESWEATDWTQIVGLYTMLLQFQDTPIVRLNRAIALLRLEGPERAWEEMEPLAHVLDEYHLWHATRAEVLRSRGLSEEARDAAARALVLTRNPAEQTLLTERLRF